MDPANVTSFDCGSYMTMFINKPLPKVVSIIPGRETPSGITHAFKENGDWKFIPEEEYETRKGELPGLSYAIQYPFAKFRANANVLPDLTETLEKIGVDEAAETHADIKSKISGESFTKDEPVYCSVAMLDGKEQRVYLKEAECLSDDSTFKMNPLIFYRVVKPAKNIAKLPVISLSKLYKQSGAEEEQIKLTVKTVNLGGQSKKNYLAQISNEETVKNFGDLGNFKKDDDR